MFNFFLVKKKKIRLEDPGVRRVLLDTCAAIPLHFMCYDMIRRTCHYYVPIRSVAGVRSDATASVRAPTHNRLLKSDA